MKTFAIYEATADGLFRLGTFKAKGHSVREVSAEFYRKHPRATGSYFVAGRIRINGKFADAAPAPMEPRTEERT